MYSFYLQSLWSSVIKRCWVLSKENLHLLRKSYNFCPWAHLYDVSQLLISLWLSFYLCCSDKITNKINLKEKGFLLAPSLSYCPSYHRRKDSKFTLHPQDRKAAYLYLPSTEITHQVMNGHDQLTLSALYLSWFHSQGMALPTDNVVVIVVSFSLLSALNYIYFHILL